MDILDTGTPRTPAGWHLARQGASYPNSYAQADYEKQGAAVIKRYTDPIRDGAVDSLHAMNDELLGHMEAATAQGAVLEDLRRQIRKRQITAKDARQARDRIRREEMKLSQLLESITAAVERDTYVRDFPEDVLNHLYEKYPSLQRPLFPF